jgi:hypothetical protein
MCKENFASIREHMSEGMKTTDARQIFLWIPSMFFSWFFFGISVSEPLVTPYRSDRVLDGDHRHRRTADLRKVENLWNVDIKDNVRSRKLCFRGRTNAEGVVVRNFLSASGEKEGIISFQNRYKQIHNYKPCFPD